MPPKTKSKKTVKKTVRAASVFGKASGRVGKTKSTKRVTRKPSTALIVIHGAGKFPKSHVEEIAADIKTIYGKPLDTFVAYYADWDEKPSTQVVVESAEAQNFKQSFRAELQKQYDALPPSARPVIVDTVPGEDSIGGLELLGVLTNEIASYLFNPAATKIIQAPLIQALKQASEYKRVILISHSMGTMVSFDVLKQVVDHYPVVRWVTLGCPLGKLRRIGIRDDNLGQITEQTVENWYNVFDTTDIVADAISPSFPKPGYRVHDIFVEVASSMPDAHDYFNNAETMRWLAEIIG